MGVDKKLEIVYDLSSLNEQQASQLISANEDVIKSAETQKKKAKRKTKKTDKAEKTKDDKKKKSLEEKEKKKIQKKKRSKGKDISTKESFGDFTAILSGSKGISFFVQQFKSAIPFIGPILLATGFFVSNLLALDKLNKKFIDIADTRINIFIDRQQQAQIDNNLQQIIYTTSVGGTQPRDSYNSFDSYDRQIKEDGINRDLTMTGGTD